MSKTCFVIAPIGETESETRKRSDQVLKHIISPAASACGYEAVRADQISEPGLITSQVIQHIVDAPLVIADLTGRNPNVYYELALRHTLRKPLVQLIAKGEQLPFDVAGMRTIIIDHHDLDSAEDSKAEIVKQIRALEKSNAQIETPISVSLNLQFLRQSDNPEQRSLADIAATVAELRIAISSIVTKLNDPSAVLPASYVRDILRTSDLVTQDEMAIRDEMAYLIGQLSVALRDNILEKIGESENDFGKSQVLRYLENIQVLLSRLSTRYRQ